MRIVNSVIGAQTSNLSGMTKSPSNLVQSLLGWIVLGGIWQLMSSAELVNSHILPSPVDVFIAFWSTINSPRPEHRLLPNVLFSLEINLVGYLESILLALPIGFALGLSKIGRGMFSQQVNSLRFVPITALGGIFIALSGLTIWTKMHFLAFGIWVYLVPVVVQRIDEVSMTHLQMMKTLGASKWQIFRYVQWPFVTSRLSDDIRILIGISWTYIIVAELKGDQGGLGHMINLGEKQSSAALVYMSIIVIVIIGVFQDKGFIKLDKLIYKFKHV